MTSAGFEGLGGKGLMISITTIQSSVRIEEHEAIRMPKYPKRTSLAYSGILLNVPAPEL